jgi:hypothetical protein
LYGLVRHYSGHIKALAVHPWPVSSTERVRIKEPEGKHFIRPYQAFGCLIRPYEAL